MISSIVFLASMWMRTLIPTSISFIGKLLPFPLSRTFRIFSLSFVMITIYLSIYQLFFAINIAFQSRDLCPSILKFAFFKKNSCFPYSIYFCHHLHYYIIIQIMKLQDWSAMPLNLLYFLPFSLSIYFLEEFLDFYLPIYIYI